MFTKLKTKAKQMKGEMYTLFLAYRHPATQWYAKVFAAVVVAYAFSPIDLIPDFIPILGYLDDLILVPLGITLAIKMIPHEALIAARQKVLQASEGDMPENWTAGFVILLIWLTIAGAGIYWFFGVFQEFEGG